MELDDKDEFSTSYEYTLALTGVNWTEQDAKVKAAQIFEETGRKFVPKKTYVPFDHPGFDGKAKWLIVAENLTIPDNLINSLNF
jgi:hypothetical protein